MESKEKYLKYRDKFLKINIYTVIIHVLSIITVLSVIFLPLFKCGFTVFGYKITNDVSIFKEFTSNLKILKGNSSYTYLFSLLIVSISPVVSAIIVICISVKQLIDAIIKLSNIEDMCMLEYSFIKKGTDENHKKNNFFKQQNIYAFIVSVFLVVICAKVFGKMLSSYVIDDEGYEIFDYSEFSPLSTCCGVSGAIALVIIEFIGYVVVSFMQKSIKKQLTLEIIKENYEKNERDTSLQEKKVDTNSEKYNESNADKNE